MGVEERPRGAGSARKLLLVEDNLGDIGLVREVLSSRRPPIELDLARDGRQRLARLSGGASFPDLILLDLNLPRMDGRELLARLKTDPELRSIPVVVYTSSSAPQDVLRAYDLQANCYLVKPLDLAGMERLFERFSAFWLETVRLPPRSDAGEG